MVYDDVIFLPSCDINLFLEGIPEERQSVPVRMVGRDWIDSDSEYELDTLNSWKAAFYPGSQDVVELIDDGGVKKLKPLKKGTVFMIAYYKEGTQGAHYLPVRVRVHGKVGSLWFSGILPYNRMSIPRKEGYYRQAPFIGHHHGESLDLTGHGYADFTPSDPSYFDVSDFDYVGFKPGQEIVEHAYSFLDVKMEGDGETLFTGSVPVYLTDPIVGPHEALERIGTPGPVAERRNLLFLPEGFEDSPDDQKMFKQIARLVTYELVARRRHSPFDLLTESFNYWYSWIPSPEPGVTVAPYVNGKKAPIPEWYETTEKGLTKPYDLRELVALVGLPGSDDWSKPFADKVPEFKSGVPDFDETRLAEDVYLKWQEQVGSLLDQVDTAFGFNQGARWGDRNSGWASGSSFDTTDSVLHQCAYEWFKPNTAARLPEPDPRRRGLSVRRLDEIIAYAETLADPKAESADKTSGSVNYRVGKVWTPDWSPDEDAEHREVFSHGLICVIVKSAHSGGVRMSDTRNGGAVIAISIGADNSHYYPPSSLSVDTAMIHRVGDVLAHELGHAFQLGDEYEENNGPVPVGRTDNNYDNIHREDTVWSAAPASNTVAAEIDPSKIKWGWLHRVDVAGVLDQPSGFAAGGIIVLTLGANTDMKEWKRREGVDTVCLREAPELNPGYWLAQSSVGQPAKLLTGLTLVNVSEADSILTLHYPVTSVTLNYAAGAAVFIPETTGEGADKFLIEQAVMDWMTTKKNALSRNHSATAPENCDAKAPKNKADDIPPEIPGFEHPSNTYRVIGLYEGGETWTCKVYRPAGACKMRSHYAAHEEGQYCFVCKYMLVNRIDPSLLGKLDGEYPAFVSILKLGAAEPTP